MILQERFPPMSRTTMTRAISGTAAGLASTGLFSAAHASEGQPAPWQMGLQPAASPVAENIHWFHNGILLPIITIITLFVLALLVIVVMRYNERANPNPSKLTHNTMIEVVWTAVPLLILAAIAIPSLKLLRQQVVIPPSDVTLKITGKQWYWTWEYPKDAGGFSFDSLMLNDQDIAKAVQNGGTKADFPRLLAVDNEAVVPVNKVIRVQVTAADVIHAFAVQSFGVKIDAVPGRLNETWFKATREGVYYGQCQELCGKDHAFMPLAIRVVSEQAYADWLAQAKKKFASAKDAGERFADASTTR
jgi:cytochrome c oxidase subunit 2